MGAGGIEKIIEVELNEDERKKFDVSIAAVQELTDWVESKTA